MRSSEPLQGPKSSILQSPKSKVQSRGQDDFGLWTGGSRTAPTDFGLIGARRLLLWLPVWIVLALALFGMLAAYQIPRSYTIEVGTPQDEAYVRNFHARLEEGGRAYRWSDVYGYVLFPGLGGSRPFTLSVA